MSILAIDYGRRKIGLALSRANFLAQRYRTLFKDKEIFSNIKKIKEKEDIDTLIFGLPRGLEGRQGTLENEAKKFAENLEQELKLPIIFVDEAFTSEEAMQNLKNQGLSLEKSKLLIDQEAARIILDEYLNTKRVIEQG